MSVGEIIKNRRKELHLSVDDLATAIGKNRATVYRYENGDIESLPIDVLEPLAQVLKVTPADLMGCEDSEYKLDLIAMGKRIQDLRIKNKMTLERFIKLLEDF